jgi:hypothetical protein
MSQESHYWVRAMYSCAPEYVVAAATNYHDAMALYEYLESRYDYVELRCGTERLNKSWIGEDDVFPDYVPSPWRWVAGEPPQG